MRGPSPLIAARRRGLVATLTPTGWTVTRQDGTTLTDHANRDQALDVIRLEPVRTETP